MSLLPVDQSHRTAALDTNQSFIVEAPAGSGKTALLIQRFLKLLAESDEPEEVVAITFTRKATAQMRNKLLAQLRKARQRLDGFHDQNEIENELDRSLCELATEVMRRDADLGWNLCEHPQRLRIATIDSFSAEIAGRLPLLARLGSTLEPTDRPEALYRAAARRTIEHLAEPTSLGEAVKTLLIEHDNDLQKCQQMIAEMLESRTQWRLLLSYGNQLDDAVADQELRDTLEAAPRHAVSECLHTLSAHLGEDECKQVHRLLKYATQWNATLTDNSDWPIEHNFSPECAERWRQVANMVLKNEKRPMWYARVSKTQGFPTSTPEQKAMVDFLHRHAGNDELRECFGGIRNMPAIAYSEEQWQIVKAYVRVLVQAVAELKVVFDENGKVDFSEIALAAVHALKDGDTETDIAAAFGTRIRHILIDELQDTSAIQYQLLKALTTGWDFASQTLFVVGDPKQSIYGFRQAEVHLFRGMQSHGLGHLTLTNLLLTTNFRSQAALVEEWNKGFSAIFTQKRPEDIPFSTATADRAIIPGAEMEVHARILQDGTAEARRDAEREQARKICAIIRHRIATNRDVKPLKIAVLARARTHLPVLLDEFRGHDIHYRALDIDPLGELQEVRDVVALTRCLLHASDRTAWLAVLRAPWCGLTLADLHALCSADDQTARDICVGELLVANLSALSPDGRARCERIRETLFAALDERKHIPLATLVEHTWHALGGPACATTQQTSNIERYFQFLREVESEGSLNDFRVLEQRLDRFFAQPQTFDENETVVDVSTIHGAKGLEWNIVFVPELQRKSTLGQARLLNMIEYPVIEDGLVLAPTGETATVDDRFYKWFCEKRKQQQEAERKRLLYVACTRARDELHVFGALALREDGQCASPTSDSLLSTAWPMVESYFVRAAGATRQSAPPTESNLLVFPTQMEALPGILPAIAATATEPVQLNQRRLPTGWRAPATAEPLTWNSSFRLSQQKLETAPFARAEGSILARATGDAIHRFLEQITRELAAGSPLAEIRSGISAKTIGSVVRSLGIAPDAQGVVASHVAAALNKTLNDPVAHWLLGQRTASMIEAAISATDDGAFRTLRVDRAFLAGDAPNTAGEDTLWLVDYKTSANGRLAIDDFLLAQQAFYSPQLTTYARSLMPLFPNARSVRLGLYFPLLGRLHHWIWREEGAQR